jgi:metal-sulfur cluster biosynthetic enzyme
MPSKEDVVEILKQINDPEIGIDIWTLELVYDIQMRENEHVYIKMTFTTPMCPYGPMLVEEVKSRISEINGVMGVEVDVVFDPPWEPSAELRATLGV